MNELISIIIPVKNGHKYLSDALTAIKAQNTDVEIIVVDDASVDDTVSIAQKFDTKIISHSTSQGPVIAKNSGLKIAQGNYIMFHDHDDIMLPDTLNKLKNKLDSHPEISMVMGKVKDFLSDDTVNKNIQCRQEPYWGLFTGATLIRKTVFDTLGLFDENLQSGEIIDLQKKMEANHLKIEKIDFVASMRRIHDTNWGRTFKKNEYKDYAAILRRSLKK